MLICTNKACGYSFVLFLDSDVLCLLCFKEQYRLILKINFYSNTPVYQMMGVEVRGERGGEEATF